MDDTKKAVNDHAGAESGLNGGLADHYKSLFERHKEESTFYQARLFHAWRSLAQQQKGLRRQAKKIKRLQQRIAELTANVK